MKSASYDVVVVGNGVVGLSVATALARQEAGLSIAMVGPQNRRGGASAAAGAMLGCFGEVTRHTLGSDVGRARFELQLAAHRRWSGELEELGEHTDGPLRVSTDTHVILNSVGGGLDSENFKAMLAALDEYGEPYEEGVHVPGLRPSPDARPLRTVRLGREGAVDSRRLLQALARRAVAAGVTTVDDTVEGLRIAGDAVVGVSLADGRENLAAGEVILTAGASTTPLLVALPDPYAVPPVYAGSGFAYVAERVVGSALTTAVRTVTRAGSCGLHAIPLGGRMEYFGATNVLFGQPELRPHLGLFAFLTEAVVGQIDRLASLSRVEELRIGNRPVSFDTFPLLGPGPKRGLWLVGAGYRDGLHASPEWADRAARSVVDAKNYFPEEFSPCRAPISTMTVAESIEDFVAQQIGSAFEGGIRLTPFQGLEDLDRMYRPMAEQLYDRLGISFGLAPDIVTFLCLTRKSDRDVEHAASYLRDVGAV